MADNSIDLKQFKGEVKPCPFCRPEEVLLGRACQHCMGNFHIATCKNCNGTGKETNASVWDGGRSKHTSTCNPCAGRGYFPARASEYTPRDYETLTSAPIPSPTITANTGIQGLIVRRTVSSGK
jgi:hypothetical protein